jgi:hypothetical protein
MPFTHTPTKWTCSTAQRSTAQHSTAQHSTAQHSTAQHSTTQHIMTGRRVVVVYAHSSKQHVTVFGMIWGNTAQLQETASIVRLNSDERQEPSLPPTQSQLLHVKQLVGDTHLSLQLLLRAD